MREFVRLQTAAMLHNFVSQVKHAARATDPDAIHDLRVAIRRLNRCLRVFARFYPGHSWKPIRRRLKELMDLCGSVRDRDIAIALLQEAGVPPASLLMKRLDRDRRAAGEELQRELHRWKRRRLSHRWRAELEV